MKAATPVPTLWAVLLATWLAGITPPVLRDDGPSPDRMTEADYASSASRRTASR